MRNKGDVECGRKDSERGVGLDRTKKKVACEREVVEG